MNGKPVKARQFWIGTAITVVTVVAATAVQVWQTKAEIESSQGQTLAQINADREKSRRVHASTLLKDISSSINAVCAQLRSHADMYFEMERCLSKPNARSNSCWRQKHTFDPVEAQQAWDVLDMNIKSASPHLEGKEELQLLERIPAIKKEHQAKLLSVLPPRSASEAETAKSIIFVTRDALISTSDKLQRAVMQPARTK